MTPSRKKRFKLLVVVAALAVTATACTSGGEVAAATATPVAAVPTEPAATARAEVETPTPPNAAGVDIDKFESFPLPDYVAGALDGDYASYLVQVEPGIKVHILEIGTGFPVYLQHGAPTSGLLYRQVAELLPADQFRVIMPTMVGLGFSTKVAAEEHTLENHVRWMNQAVQALELQELIYVGHDWGGPVGMGALARSPQLLAGAVMLNTSLGAPAEPVEFSPGLQQLMAPVPPGAESVVVAAIFEQLAGAQNDPESMSPDVTDLYRRPVLESDNPIGPLSIVRMAADGPDHPTAEVLREIDNYLTGVDVPVEIVWGTNDPFLGDRLPRMTEIFPNAPVTRTDAGHFLQEEADAPEEIAAAIQRVREQVGSQQE